MWSYVLALKAILYDDKYRLCENSVLLTAVTRACKLNNDQVKAKLPIRHKLLEMLLFEIECMYNTQPYLVTLYQAILALGYYGLFRVGELGKSQHSIKAANVHVAMNKRKIQVVHYSSKTHNEGFRPQTVKISAAQIGTSNKE